MTTVHIPGAKLGVVQFMAYPATMKGEGPILDSFRALCADPTWEVLEVTWVKDAHTRLEAIRMAADARKTIAYGAQPRLLSQKLDLNSADPEARARAVAEIKAAIDEAVVWNAVGCAFLSGKDPGPEGRADARKRLVDSINEICAYAATVDPDLRIVLETFDRQPYGKNALIGPTSEAVEVCRAVRQHHPQFGIMLDLSHLPLLEETPDDAISTAGDCLVHAHFGNCVMKNPKNPYYGDEHPTFGCRDGENDVDQLVDYIQALRQSGYLDLESPRILTLEVKPMGAETPEGVLSHSKDVIRRAAEKLHVH
ncbi:TIM barrel protein [bacterium]|nr:TIM barrel protein [bacterium]